MPKKSMLRRIAQDESGAAAVLLALAAPPLVGAAAVAVDLGSLYLAERQLQGMADAAAASAVTAATPTEAEAAALAAIAAGGAKNTRIHSLETGKYYRDPELDFNERFVPGVDAANAVKIELVSQVPLFFGSFLTDEGTSQIVATATAARVDMISFDIGSKLASVSGGLPGSILSQLAGSELSLSDEDVTALASGTIDVLDYAEALRALQGQPERAFGEVFDADTPLHTAVEAMADSVDDPVAAAALRGVAETVDGSSLMLSDMIDLGPYRPVDVNDGRTNVEVDAYSMLRTMLELTHEDGYDIQVDLNVAGLSNTVLRAAGGRGYERSPWLTLSEAYDVIVRTADTRLYVETSVGTGLSALGQLRLPLYTELAAAEARLNDVTCDGAVENRGASLAVKPSLGEVALADIDQTKFGDLNEEMFLEHASLLTAAGVTVTGYADLALGGESEQVVGFTLEEIRAHTRKDVGTSDLTATLVASLLDDVEVGVNGTGLGLTPLSGMLEPAVTTALEGVAGSLDALLFQTTSALGVKLGVADVSINNIRCGQPTIVA